MADFKVFNIIASYEVGITFSAIYPNRTVVYCMKHIVRDNQNVNCLIIPPQQPLLESWTIVT